MPATPQCTPLASEATGEFREHVLRLNAPASLAGLPVLAVPLGGNPVQTTGIQCIGATDSAPFETIIAAWRYRR
jgi:Asp-tRNA(Asn)/Glu-tRNA(Gln) amidotransferase A subunit family amidase